MKQLNSTGITHNLAEGLQTSVFLHDVKVPACFTCNWPAIFVPYVPRGRTGGRRVYSEGGEEEKYCYNF